MLAPATVLAVSAGAVLLLDQGTKHVAVRRLRDGQAVLGGALRVRHVVHRRARPTTRTLAVIWAAALAAAVLLVHVQAEARLAPIALGAALGGGAGNLVDRWRAGGVVDVLEVTGLGVGNLADVAVVVGVAVGLLAVLL